jgi:hypothetical protein
MRALSHCRRTIYVLGRCLFTLSVAEGPLPPAQNLTHNESRQDITRVPQLTRKPGRLRTLTLLFPPRCRSGGSSDPLPFVPSSVVVAGLATPSQVAQPSGLACHSGAGRRAATAPSLPGGKAMRPMRSRNDLRAAIRLLVRGVASCRPDAGRRRRVPVPRLFAGQDRSAAEFRESKRSLRA